MRPWPEDLHPRDRPRALEGGQKESKYNIIVLYLLPVLNPKSYDGARVLEASGRPIVNKIEEAVGSRD